MPAPAATNTQAAPVKRFASLSEAAERYDVSERTIRRLIADGKLKALRIGGSIRIPLTELDRLDGANPIGNARSSVTA